MDNKYNGAGGSVEEGETYEQAMLREAFEELGIIPTEYQQIGALLINNKVELPVYIVTKFNGVIKETDEMKPVWFDINSIPYCQMVEDYKIWFSNVLMGQEFLAHLHSNENNNLHSFLVEKRQDKLQQLTTALSGILRQKQQDEKEIVGF